MNFWANNEEYEIEPDGLHIVAYPNDIMNGMLIDMDEQYGFVSDHDTERACMIRTASDEGATLYDLSDLDDDEIDLTNPPHTWVVNGLAKIIIEYAEDLCRDSIDD